MATVSSTGTLSSLGIGSGLDVNSIVSQLVALEKAPLVNLQLNATNIQSQISAFGQVQSQMAALTDVATRIADPTVWSARTTSSSDSSAATITATGTAMATTLSVDVDALALQQSVSSAAIAPATTFGTGTLSVQTGTWTGTGGNFAAGSSAAVSISVASTDTVADIAANINAANAGVKATVFSDGTNQRLLLNSATTGAAAGFTLTSADAGLQGLVFDPQGSPGVGMAATGNPVQYAQDAKARINGLAVTSKTNTLTGNIPGVTINLLATTTTGYGTGSETKNPLTLRIAEDVTSAVKNVSDFVTAYNTLNTNLNALTKYDAATKVAGVFQGDSVIVGLQNLMRSMLASASTGASSQYLSDVGIERQLDGSLSINTAKLSVAANNGTTLQQLFTTNNNNAQTNGFALKFKSFGTGVAASGGSLTAEGAALQKSLDSNTAAQTQVNDRAATVQANLQKRYSALDAQMAQLTALNSYVSQQVAQWNKTSS